MTSQHYFCLLRNMRSAALFFLIFLRLPGISAQVTIVKGAPNQVFNLSCAQCTVAVEDVALWKGVRVLPYHKTKSGLTNLLNWKYYDSIMKSEVTTDHELPWEKCTQLLDSIRHSDTVSLQINLVWTDSSTQVQRIYLLLGGLLKSDLAQMPLESVFDADAMTLKHFAAIAQIKHPDGKTETYETISGEIALTSFDPKTGAISGSFDFSANCIGWLKRGVFQDGIFERK